MDETKNSKLPKNVKQIGQAPDGHKVYMEDYVITYLKQMLVEEKEMKVSILYGHKEIFEDELYWFVSGAVEAETDFFMERTVINEESWQKVNELAGHFFRDMTVLGWAIARPETADDMSEQILRTQKTFFRADQKLFFEYITDEKQENLYVFEKGKMRLQSGYYIYYDRNERMQNYMVSLRATERHPEEFEADRTMRQIRENREQKREQRSRRKTTTLLTCFSMILVTTIMIIGVTMLNNYEKMQSMERVLYQISGKIDQADHMEEASVQAPDPADNLQIEAQETLAGVSAQVLQEEPEIMTDGGAPVTDGQAQETEDGQAQKEQTQPERDTQVAEEDMQSEEDAQVTEEDTQAEEDTQTAEEGAQSEEDAQMQEDPAKSAVETIQQESGTTYLIRKGDTLVGICMQYYGNLSHLEEICTINGIEDKNSIFYGQKIYLP